MFPSIHPSVSLCVHLHIYLLTNSFYLVALPKWIPIINTCEGLWSFRVRRWQPHLMVLLLEECGRSGLSVPKLPYLVDWPRWCNSDVHQCHLESSHESHCNEDHYPIRVSLTGKSTTATRTHSSTTRSAGCFGTPSYPHRFYWFLFLNISSSSVSWIRLCLQHGTGRESLDSLVNNLLRKYFKNKTVFSGTQIPPLNPPGTREWSMLFIASSLLSPHSQPGCPSTNGCFFLFVFKYLFLDEKAVIFLHTQNKLWLTFYNICSSLHVASESSSSFQQLYPSPTWNINTWYPKESIFKVRSFIPVSGHYFPLASGWKTNIQ